MNIYHTDQKVLLRVEIHQVPLSPFSLLIHLFNSKVLIEDLSSKEVLNFSNFTKTQLTSNGVPQVSVFLELFCDPKTNVCPEFRSQL